MPLLSQADAWLRRVLRRERTRGLSMGWMGNTLGALASWALVGLAPALSGQAAPVDFGDQYASRDAREVVQWIMESADHNGLPFAIVDKRQARIYVFDGSGRLSGADAVLLGQAMGDDSAPGVGEHAQMRRVPAPERTTPAGRFVSQPGHNLSGDAVVWVDYAAAFAIHRLRAGAGYSQGQKRLASRRAVDRRASLGCVVVAAAFYRKVVWPLLGRGPAMVYVLPEMRSMHDVFGGL